MKHRNETPNPAQRGAHASRGVHSAESSQSAHAYSRHNAAYTQRDQRGRSTYRPQSEVPISPARQAQLDAQAQAAARANHGGHAVVQPQAPGAYGQYPAGQARPNTQ